MPLSLFTLTGQRILQWGVGHQDTLKTDFQARLVSLEFEGRERGKYGRLLAYVILNGENFNLDLVREGWSPYYTKYGNSENHHAEFLAVEREAREKGLNIWTGTPLPKNDNPNISSTLLHGNVKSMKFHGPGCPHFNCKNCTKAFPSRHEAMKAGYKPCGICKP